MTQAESVWSRTAGVASVDDGHRVVLLALHSAVVNQPVILVGPARLIWHALKGGASPRQIARSIMDGESEADGRIAAQAQEFLQHLEDLGLAQLRAGTPSTTAGQQPG